MNRMANPINKVVLFIPIPVQGTVLPIHLDIRKLHLYPFQHCKNQESYTQQAVMNQ